MDFIFESETKKGNSRDVRGSMKNYFFQSEAKKKSTGVRVYEKLHFHNEAKNKSAGGSRVCDNFFSK